MTATFEFVCETFVITFKGKICSDSNKYIVSYGWHWNQWIWRSSSRCECVDQLCQLGCLASCVFAHLVVQYIFYLFSKYILSPLSRKNIFIFFAHLVFQNKFYLLIKFILSHLSFQNIFYLFCSPGCSKYIFSWHFHKSNTFWSYHH